MLACATTRGCAGTCRYACTSPIVGDQNSCGDRRDDVLDDRTFAAARGRIPRHVHVADMSPQFCNSTRSWAVKDNVVIHRGSHHMTAIYARHIAPALLAAIKKIWRPRIRF